MEKNHLNNKTNRSKAIRRLVIWYRRNSAVTSLVDTATSSATAASNVAGTVVSNAGSVVTSAGSIARSTLEPFVFDPLRRLQGGESTDEKNTIQDSDRIWVAVDGMGGDYAPGAILDGCLKSLSLLPLKIKFVGEIDKIKKAALEFGLKESLDKAIDDGNFELIASGLSVGMDEEATAVRKKKDASINIAMKLVREGKAMGVYSAGNSGAMMASAIFKLGRLKGIDRPAIGALFPTKDPGQPVLVLDVGANMDCKPTYLHQFALLGNIYSRDVLQVDKPRIGLLNIGEESCKGNDLSLATYKLLDEEERFLSLIHISEPTRPY